MVWHENLTGRPPKYGPEIAEVFGALFKSGMSQAQIGEAYGLSQGRVSQLLRTLPWWKPNYRRAWTPERRLLAAALYDAGLTMEEVAATLTTSTRHVRAALESEGVQIRPSYSFPSGQANPSYKQGRTLLKGYWQVRLPSHPQATKHGYVAEHRLVMESMIGRRLKRSEVVHHKDGDTQNNAPDNLQLFASNAEHLATTLKGKRPKWTKSGWSRIQASNNRLRKAK
jgi:hypothetical protein